MSKDKAPLSRQTLRQIASLLKPLKGRYLALFSLIFLVQLLQLVTPYLFKFILDSLVGLTPDRLPRIYALLGFSLAVAVVLSLVKLFRDRKIFGFLLELERFLPIRAQTKLMELTLAFHEQRDTGNMIAKVQRGVDRFVDLMANALFEFIPTVLQTLATFGLLLYLNWRIALLFFPVIPAFVWLTAWMNQRVRPLRVRVFKGYEQAGGQMAQTLMNVQAVQSFAQETREIAEHSAIRNAVFRDELQTWQLILKFNFWRDNLISLGQSAVLLFAVFLLVRQQITVGTLVLLLTLSQQAYYSLFRISRLYDRGAEWAEAVRRLTDLLNEQPQITDPPLARPLVQTQGAIEFDDVSFLYGNGKEVLRNVSLRIESGTTVALVGPSGCGKSTLVKLLFRHFDPTSGVIRLDGQPLHTLTRESFRRQMAIVPQDVGIFNRTIRQNIAYAKPAASDNDIIRTAKLANAHEFILSLPKGYETLVGERGLKLSGGQRQRIGIARALLADPKILVFDEATSSLDSHAEAIIQREIFSLATGRTTLIIAHRLSTIRQADWIVVFDSGMIVEQGTHDQLIRADGLYRYLSELQVDSTTTLRSFSPPSSA